MDKKEQNEVIQHILNEFKLIDSLFASIKDGYITKASQLIKKYEPSLEINGKLTEIIDNYAQELINLADSVIDKDKNYSEYRLIIELKNISRVAETYPQTLKVNLLAKYSLHAAKVLITDNFKGVYKLSATGYRVLNQILLCWNHRFMSDIMQDKQ